MHSAMKREQFEKFKAIDLQKRESMYRNVRQIIALLVKISKLASLYPVDDPVYDEFTETIKTNLDAIANTLPIFVVNIKKVGFYYVEKRLKILDEGEKDFRNVFIVNEIREIAFIAGITPEEVRKFFGVIAKTIAYTGSEYDFNTLMWDYGISHIICMSDQDTGETENLGKDDLSNRFFSFPPAAAIDLREIAALTSEFDSLFTDGPEQLAKFLENNGDRFALKKYLLVVSRLILSDNDLSITRRLVDQVIEYTEKLLLTGQITYGITFLAVLMDIAPKLEEAKNPHHERVAEQLKKIGAAEFVDKMFDLAVKLRPEETESFGNFLNLVSPSHFEKVFMRLTELNSKEVRLHCLKGIAKDFNNYETAKKLFASEDWHIIRNALYLLGFIYNTDFVPLVRAVMNHEQKQVRIEATRVLAKYDADDNLPFWQKAIFSPDKEVRLLAVKSIVKIKGFQAKNILDSALRPQNISLYGLDELPLFFEAIIASARSEFFDLIAIHLFSADKKFRMMVIAAIKTMSSTETVSHSIAKRIASPEFRDLDRDEIEQLLSLIREDSIPKILPALDYVITLQGGFFAREKYRPFKEIVFSQIGKLRKFKLAQGWLLKALAEGNDETKDILKKLGIKK